MIEILTELIVRNGEKDAEIERLKARISELEAGQALMAPRLCCCAPEFVNVETSHPRASMRLYALYSERIDDNRRRIDENARSLRDLHSRERRNHDRLAYRLQKLEESAMRLSDDA